MQKLSQLNDQLNLHDTKVVAVAQAADNGVLKAVKMALDKQLAHFLLMGPSDEIERAANEAKLDLTRSGVDIVPSSRNDAAVEAVKAISNSQANVLMKGNLPTKTILQAVLNKEFGLRKQGVLSHVALFEIPEQKRLIFLTDSAMNISPDLDEKAAIINNAVGTAQRIGYHTPKVAALSAVEVVNSAMSASTDAALLTQMNKRGQITGCDVDGPLAFDNAISLEAAKQKGIDSSVAGQADILLAPTIEVANSLYKSFVYFAHAKVAGIISGAAAPIVLTSRADSAESKVTSLTLAILSSD
ncbi:bifunctional enoyl-CoA hydratase/phosphate acetyltransferase [Thalassobacillus sp. CUG 92003]|uniref:bifunctional enoyl-CoA hydratase/phosphate acetyltransferase n=1 Tax=Thalassobacillus sp. CUG 92003 TaxID=2736641 RepID=UPI0015E75E07|nr:bifunctional enoyl-CoA hydratase/phosphate acetyltransferase [Thalassobacillus sp. CUG 92003]